MSPSKIKSWSAKRNEELSIRERVLAAAKVLEAAGDSRSLTISAICRAAGVNRANLYSSHRDLLAELLARFKSKCATESPVRGDRLHYNREHDLSERLAQSEDRYKKLLLVCTEQQAEINWLRLQLRNFSHSR
ncbi:helix-turn-helix transcriptional regulator [Paraburkholderia sp. Se-20369]|nr:helix-turn-helix transcriptional regulator [Paraburkholderia sp. Se-20369]